MEGKFLITYLLLLLVAVIGIKSSGDDNEQTEANFFGEGDPVTAERNAQHYRGYPANLELTRLQSQDTSVDKSTRRRDSAVLDEIGVPESVRLPTDIQAEANNIQTVAGDGVDQTLNPLARDLGGMHPLHKVANQNTVPNEIEFKLDSGDNGMEAELPSRFRDASNYNIPVEAPQIKPREGEDRRTRNLKARTQGLNTNCVRDFKSAKVQNGYFSDEGSDGENDPCWSSSSSPSIRNPPPAAPERVEETAPGFWQRTRKLFAGSKPNSHDRELARVRRKFNSTSDMLAVHKFISFAIRQTPENPTIHDADVILQDLFNNDDNLVFSNPSRFQAAVNESPYLKGISISKYLPLSARFLSFVNRIYHDFLDMLPDRFARVLSKPMVASHTAMNNFLLSVIHNARIDQSNKNKLREADSVSNYLKLMAFNFVGRRIRSIIFSKMPMIVENIKKAKVKEFFDIKEFSQQIRTDGLPKDLQFLVREGIETYFDNMPYEIKRDMFAQLLELPPGTLDADSVVAIVMEGGPIMQKLLQLIGENSQNPVLVNAMSRLKSSITPIKTEVLKHMLSHIYKNHTIPKVHGTLCVAFDKLLGSASVGQVHSAILTNPLGKPSIAAVKFKRPTIEKKTKIEKEVLGRVVSGVPGLGDLWERVCESVTEELDYDREFHMMKEGHKWYNLPKERIVVPNARFKLPESSPQLIVMEYASGKSFNKLTREELSTGRTACNVRQALTSFARVWMQNSLFKSEGFFHGDPHSGNLLYDVESQTMSVIDFGNAHYLTPEVQKRYVDLIWGIALKDKKYVLSGLNKTVDSTNIEQWSNLEDDIDRIFRLSSTQSHTSSRMMKRNWFTNLLSRRMPALSSNVSEAYDSEESENELPSACSLKPNILTARDDVIGPQIVSAAIKQKIQLPANLENFVRAKSFITKVFESLEDKAGDIFSAQGCPLGTPDDVWKWVLVKNLRFSCLYRYVDGALRKSIS